MAKDKNQNFDNYVKKAMANDPLVPSGLDWENMDIAIPEKRKRKLLLFYFIGFFVIGGMFFSGYYFNRYLSQDESSITENPIQHASKDVSGAIITDAKLIESKAIKNDVDAKSNIGIGGIRDRNTSIQPKVIVNTKGTNLNSTIVSETTIESQSSNAQNEISIPQNNNIVSEDVTVTSILSEESNPIILESLDDVSKPNLHASGANLSELAIPVIYSQDLKMLFVSRSTLISPRPIDLDINDNSKTKNEISLKVGMNIGSFNLASNSELNGRLTNVLGRSIQLGYQRSLGNNFILNTSIDYSENHTVFEHSEEIGRQNNFTSQTQIITCQHTYQNNYSKTIGLSAGLGYRFEIFSSFEIQTNISLNSNKLISVAGLTLSKEEVVNLNDLQYDKSVNLNVAPSVDLRYSVNNNFGIQLSYIYNRTISNGIDLGNNVQRNSMSQFLSGVYMTF